MNVFELFAKLSLNSDDYESKLGKAGEAAKTVGAGIGKAFKLAGTVAVAGLTAATGATVALVKSATDAYANYEQLVGGVETLFKDSAGTVQEYANEAYRTAGLSANEYMETVTSFSASLLQSLGGDTQKAAEMADMAIIDMSDNANKMGSDMSAIQNAYNGFAKQNYTMLDNLKLGYGGTKEEMERLLADAEKLSGVKYDVSSYGDIVQAIHVVQTEMGITGTTAEEAASTISGSLGMMKAQWKNLVTAIAAGDEMDLGANIDQFVGTVKTAFSNLVPVIKKSLSGINTLISEIVPIIVEELPGLIDDLLPELLDSAANLLSGLVGALPSLIQVLVDALPGALENLMDSIIDVLPILIDSLVSLIVMLATNISSIIEPLVAALPDIINQIVAAFPVMIPALIQGAASLVVMLVTHLPEIIKALIDAIPVIIESIKTGFEPIVEKLKEVFQKAWDKVVGIWDKFKEWFANLGTNAKEGAENIFNNVIEWFQKLPETLGYWLGYALASFVKWALQMVEKAKTEIPKVISKVVEFFKQLPGKMWDKLLEAIQKFKEFASKMIDTAKEKIPEIVNKVVEFFSELPGKITEIGKNLIEGLWNGIQDKWEWLKEKIASFGEGFISAIKDVFGVHSPSRKTKWIGEMLAVGLGDGWDDTFKKVKAGIDSDLSMDFSTTISGKKAEENALVIQLEELQKNFVNDMVTAISEGLTWEWDDRQLGRMVRTYA